MVGLGAERKGEVTSITEPFVYRIMLPGATNDRKGRAAPTVNTGDEASVGSVAFFGVASDRRPA
jgi:hypothetical protein